MASDALCHEMVAITGSVSAPGNRRGEFMRKIKITLHKDGTQKVEVLGAVGEGCLEFTEELEKRLGVQEGERVLKPEYELTESEVEYESEVDR
jgi:hypothetical protein